MTAGGTIRHGRKCHEDEENGEALHYHFVFLEQLWKVKIITLT